MASCHLPIGPGSPDGKFPRDGVDNTLKMLRASLADMADAKIRIDDTYTNRFVDQASRAK
jgi:hypothetical protein